MPVRVQSALRSIAAGLSLILALGGGGCSREALTIPTAGPVAASSTSVPTTLQSATSLGHLGSSRAIPWRPLSDEEAAASSWLAEGVADLGGSPDPFFRAFMMGDSAFFGDHETWSCIFDDVLRALGVPATREEQDSLLALAAEEPGFPVAHRGDVRAVLAALTEADRIRLGTVVITAAEACGDLRLGLFSGGGALPVCIYDRLDDDRRARVVALSMLFDSRGGPSLPGWLEELSSECLTIVRDAFESGEGLDWATALQERYQRELANAAQASPAPAENADIELSQQEDRSVPAPEWVGLEFYGAVDLDTGVERMVNLSLPEPQPEDLFGGYVVAPFWRRPFTVVEFWGTREAGRSTPGERLVLLTEWIHVDGGRVVGDDVVYDIERVIDAMTVSQYQNERLVQCRVTSDGPALGLVTGLRTSTGVVYVPIDAWAVSRANGFERIGSDTIHCRRD